MAEKYTNLPSGSIIREKHGAVAHLVERQVRNLKVAGSSPVGSKSLSLTSLVDSKLNR